MDNQDLRENLEKLQREIELTKSVDEKGQTLLRNLENEIRELLDRSENDSSQPHLSIVTQLEDSMRHFEVTHPALTGAMEQLMAILGNAGI